MQGGGPGRRGPCVQKVSQSSSAGGRAATATGSAAGGGALRLGAGGVAAVSGAGLLTGVAGVGAVAVGFSVGSVGAGLTAAGSRAAAWALAITVCVTLAAVVPGVAEPKPRAPPLSLKAATAWASRPAWSLRLSAAAADSSTSAAFCCVIWSSCVTAWLTWPMPSLCSLDAALISPMMSDTRCTLVRISFIELPASFTRREPDSTFSLEALISVLISLAACALRWDGTVEEATRLVRALDFGSYANPVGSAKASVGGHVLLVAALDAAAQVSGAAPGQVHTSLRIHAHDTLVDHTWLWRADHGQGVGWDSNPSAHGLWVEGEDVTVYGLFVEHFQQAQVVWRGNGGRVYFYQSELPYDPPTQADWRSATGRGHPAYLVDPAVMDLSAPAAAALGIGALALGWVVYDRICRSRLGESETGLAAIGLLAITLAAFGFSQVFSGRGALIHTGALMATWMAGNVFFLIIPNQRKVVKALIAGEEPDPALGKQAKQRSVHNNYLTLPVIFMMISNHYALATGHPYNWAFLIAIGAIGGLIRHWFNVKHRTGQRLDWIWAASAAGVVAMVLFSGWRPDRVSTEGVQAASLGEVHAIAQARCTPCHSAHPTQEGFADAPAGIMLDTPDQLYAARDSVFTQVSTGVMPPGNLTQLTDEERAAILAWYEAGAPAE